MTTHIGEDFVPPLNDNGPSLDAALRRQVISAWRASKMAGTADEDAAFYRGKAHGIEQARQAVLLSKRRAL